MGTKILKKYRLSSCPGKKDGNPVFSSNVKTTKETFLKMQGEKIF